MWLPDRLAPGSRADFIRLHHPGGKEKLVMEESVRLPLWLDERIFAHHHAHYSREFADMTVLEWGKDAVLGYLGTYFPRSFAESYTICRRFLEVHPDVYGKKKIMRVLDFGCGCGGNLLGLAAALDEQRPKIQKVRAQCVDGNKHGMRILEDLARQSNLCSRIQIEIAPVLDTVDDFSDMDVLCRALWKDFDFAMAFKSICEFVTKRRFSAKNPYTHFIDAISPKMGANGRILIGDVSSRNTETGQWIPEMLDNAVNATHHGTVLSNEDFNQQFTVSHSHCVSDRSKLAWRIIEVSK